MTVHTHDDTLRTIEYQKLKDKAQNVHVQHMRVCIRQYMRVCIRQYMRMCISTVHAHVYKTVHARVYKTVHAHVYKYSTCACVSNESRKMKESCVYRTALIHYCCVYNTSYVHVCLC